MNATYSDFINKFTRTIDSSAMIKKVRVKANSKPWFDSEIISAVQKEANYIQDIKSVKRRNR